MKISNQRISNNSISLRNNKNNTNFKAIAPDVIKQIKNISSSSGNKEIVLKLASLAGLTSIIAWVKAFKGEPQADVMNKLDIIDTNWSQKGNELFLNPIKQGEYLDLVSKADSAEAVLWTKGTLANTTVPTTIKEISQAEKDLFLTLETNEAYLSNSAKATIKSIISQVQALSGAPEEVKNNALKSIDLRLNSLVKEADSLQHSQESAEIYNKIANIIKLFAFTNLAEGTEKTSEEEFLSSTINNSTPAVNESENAGENISSLKVVGRIDLKPTGKNYFKPDKPIESESESKISNETSKQIIITDKNKDFVEEIFKKAFKRNSHIKPELYSDYIDFIQEIYYSYSEEKGSLRRLFLLNLTRENSLKMLELYNKLTSGKAEKIDYISFSDFQNFKHMNGGDLTQKDFDTLNGYKNSKIKYYMVKPQDEKIVVAFSEDTSVEDRLKIITDMHRIAFNITDTKTFNAQLVNSVELKDVKEELISKLLIDPEDYVNITSFLGLNLEEAKYAIDDGDYNDASRHIEHELNSYNARMKLNNLIQALNNDAFKGFSDTTHGRMRFLERIIFDSTRNMTKTPYEIKQITSKEILKLKNTIERAKTIDIYNYNAKRANGTSVHKYAPQIKLGKITIGLNDKGQLHTIY